MVGGSLKRFFNILGKSNTASNVRSFMGLGSKFKKDTGKYEVVQIGLVYEEHPVPNHIEKPSYYYEYEPPHDTEGDAEIKGLIAISGVRKSCEIAATILKNCRNIIDVGVTTEEIDRFVHYETIKANAYPSPLNYGAFPKSVCTSVNNVACHGIPDDRPLADGDIINVDISVYFNKYHGDCSTTFLVGNVDEDGRRLVRVTEECLYKAISICGPNVPFNKIGNVIEEHAKKNGLNVVPDFVGHGIGTYFHGPPTILHYANKFRGEMKPNMTFTIEPILSLGSPRFRVLEDHWTAVTVDNSRTAQFEHTILITRDGCEILTIAPEEKTKQN